MNFANLTALVASFIGLSADVAFPKGWYSPWWMKSNAREPLCAPHKVWPSIE